MNDIIIQAFQKGDTRIILNCYKAIYKDVLAYVLKNSGTEQQAQELIWTAFEKFRQKCLLADFTIETNFKAYIFGICRYTWIDHLRIVKKQRMTQSQIHSLAPENDAVDIHTPPISEEQEQTLHLQQTLELTAKAILDLSALCREIFTLWGTEGKSHKEIATLLHIKPDASRKRLKDCRKKLKKRLKALYGNILEDEPLMRRFIDN